MEAIALDLAPASGKAMPPRASAGETAPFEDFLPADEADTPPPTDAEPPRADSSRPRPAPSRSTARQSQDESSDDADASESDPAAAGVAVIANTAAPSNSPPAASGAAPTETAAAGKAGTATAGQPTATPTITPTVSDKGDKTAPTATAGAAPTAAQVSASGSPAPGNKPSQTRTPAGQIANGSPQPFDAGAKSSAPSPAPTDKADATGRALPPEPAARLQETATSDPARSGPAQGATAQAATQMAPQTAVRKVGDGKRPAAEETRAGRDSTPARPANTAATAGPSAPAAAQTAQAKAQPAAQGATSQGVASQGTTLQTAAAAGTDAKAGGTQDALPVLSDDGGSTIPPGGSIPGNPSLAGLHGHTGPAAAAGSRPMPAPPALATQIAVQIYRGVQQGADRISIHLSPAELGRIEVKLDLSHDGRVHAAIAADRPETLNLLQRDARGLEQALQDAGLKADSGGLTFNLRNGGQQAFNSGSSTPGSLSAGGRPATGQPPRMDPLSGTGAPWRRTDRAIDIRV